MRCAKLSISIPGELAEFVERYRKKRRVNRSQVFEEALKLLRNRQLEAAYKQASAEHEPAWENTAGDGLSDETW